MQPAYNLSCTHRRHRNNRYLLFFISMTMVVVGELFATLLVDLHSTTQVVSRFKLKIQKCINTIKKFIIQLFYRYMPPNDSFSCVV
jgi:hypothetical protein